MRAYKRAETDNSPKHHRVVRVITIGKNKVYKCERSVMSTLFFVNVVSFIFIRILVTCSHETKFLSEVLIC